MDEKEIIDKLFARSNDALAEIITKYGKLCHSISRSIVGNNEDAEECVDDAMVKIWCTIPPNRPKSFKAYLLKIVRNISLDKYSYNEAGKRSVRHKICIEELNNDIPATASVEDEIDTTYLAEYIQSFLGTLDKDERIMFVSRYWYMDSNEEIAKLLGISKGGVRIKLHRIRMKLKDYLEERGYRV